MPEVRCSVSNCSFWGQGKQKKNKKIKKKLKKKKPTNKQKKIK